MKIHVVGVGGIAMGNLAAMLRKIGHEVSGSDQNLYPPMSDRLKEWKIQARPFDKKSIAGAHLVIIGNVITRGNPEVEEVLERGIDYMSMPEALRHFFLKGREVICVAGTHGKTTTTFLIDHILNQAGLKPGLFVGGVRADGHDGFRVPDSKYFVIEGDEYDSAFFDKGSKFLHYRPRYLALNAIEFDHADIFNNLDEYVLPFKRLLRVMPHNGLVVANHDSVEIRNVLKDYTLCPIEYFANKKRSSVLGFTRSGSTLKLDGLGSCKLRLIGDYNARNALAASRIALRIGVDKKQILKALESFPGVLRRQQIRLDQPAGDSPALALIEDFAHHPTAVIETIAAVRQSFKGRRVTVFFEPRSATSHRNIFQKEYSTAFQGADSVYISDLFNKQKVPANSRLNVAEIIKSINKKKKDQAHYGADPSSLFEVFSKTFVQNKKGDVIVVLSNGAFGGIYQKLEQFLAVL